MALNNCITACECNFSMSNTGVDCTPLMQVVKKLLFMPVYDSTGVRNYIDLTVAINAATFTAMINNTDASKRLYPLPEFKDIKDLRGEPKYQTFADDSKIFVAPGIRNFDGIIVGQKGAGSPQLLQKIESARCGEMGVYAVDRLGNLIGIISSDGTQLFPIRIDSESLTATLIKTTDTTVQGVQVKFNYHPDEYDNCLRMVQNSEMTSVDLLTLKGLLNVFATFSGLSTTGATMKLFTEYGSVLTPVVVKGLVTADFVSSVTATASKVRNSTDSADVTVTVTESTTVPGTYTLAWVAQTSADQIIIKPKKNGFDFAAVEAAPITIP